MSEVRILLCTIRRFSHAGESRDQALTKVTVGGSLARQISGSSKAIDYVINQITGSSPQYCLRSIIAPLMYSRSYIKAVKERLTQIPAIK